MTGVVPAIPGLRGREYLAAGGEAGGSRIADVGLANWPAADSVGMSLIFRGGVIQMSERGVIDVLHVEDDPGYALIVRKSFAQASRNCRFHAVTDGRQALRFLRRAGEHAGAPRPGLIILDLDLPGLHGLEVLAEIKADPDLMIISVVILSSSRNPGDIRRGYELHANAYVVKPEDMDGFDGVIRGIAACFTGLIERPPPG
jgi:CheY-like chemotaxis protein